MDKETSAPVTSGQENEQPQITFLSDLISDLCADAERRHAAKLANRPLGPVTGLPGLDDKLGGFVAPGIHTITGNSGTGKTTFALQVAANCGFPALFVTCEMSMRALLYRLVAQKTDTFLRKLKSGDLSGKEITALAVQTAKTCPRLAFLNGTQEFVSAAKILKSAKILKERMESDHVLIVIDSLHAWTGSGRGDTGEYDAIEAALTTLREITSRMDCPIMLLSHRSRTSNKSNGSDALNSAKGNGSIEHYSQTMIDLNKKEPKAKPDANGEYVVNLSITKNRDEATHYDIPMLFSGRLQKYREEKAIGRGAM